MTKKFKILFIIQSSNGDVFISSPLINALYQHYNHPAIDLLVNDDTLQIAKTLSHVNHIYQFSYKRKHTSRFTQEKEIIKNIYKKYDLSISLTASDRSAAYAILAGKTSISGVDPELRKSWWKRLLLTYYYEMMPDKHMILYSVKPLELLGINLKRIMYKPTVRTPLSSLSDKFSIKMEYIVFHPSAQYWFRTYPIDQINKLLELLERLKIQIILTGGNDPINQVISSAINRSINIINLIGKTTIDEFYAIIESCKVFIGMDTLATHIAASFNKHIVAIYGPNGVTQWSPFNVEMQYAPQKDTPPITRYGNITILQANMSCVPCNRNGCYGKGRSECLYAIAPETVFGEVKKWLSR